MKILKKEWGNTEYNWNYLIDDFQEHSFDIHRKGSNFYRKSIIQINETYFPNLDKEYYGFYETNTYIYDDNYGVDRSEIIELTKVEKKTKLVEVTYWEPIEEGTK